MCGPVLTFPLPKNEYMKDDFCITIETWHKPDLGKQENVSIFASLANPVQSVQTCLTCHLMLVQVHKLDSSKWKDVTVVPIDIADRSPVSAAVSKSSSRESKE